MKSTVTISLEEHDRLRKVEEGFNALISDDGTRKITIHRDWYTGGDSVVILNPDETMEILDHQIQALNRQITDLKSATKTPKKKTKWYHIFKL